MDKKKKMAWVAGFVVVCGVVCLFLHYGRERKRQIVTEKTAEVTEFSEEDRIPEEDSQGREESQSAKEQETVLYVHLCGAVKTEGVYELPSGSRLRDGIVAAGGFLEVADTTYHNLAARLKDGQRIYVPTKEETKTVTAEDRIANTGDVSGTRNKIENTKVNLNTADIEELMTLSGVGEAKAESILQYREKVGEFQSIEELKNVSGIGDAMFERIKEDITVE